MWTLWIGITGSQSALAFSTPARRTAQFIDIMTSAQDFDIRVTETQSGADEVRDFALKWVLFRC